MTDSSLARARSALAECDATVERLHKLCCEPERSPEMMAIEDVLEEAREDIGLTDPESLARAIDGLADVGARLGSLQVTCCATVRMPLYAEALRQLNSAQVGISEALGRAH